MLTQKWRPIFRGGGPQSYGSTAVVHETMGQANFQKNTKWATIPKRLRTAVLSKDTINLKVHYVTYLNQGQGAEGTSTRCLGKFNLKMQAFKGILSLTCKLKKEG